MSIQRHLLINGSGLDIVRGPGFKDKDRILKDILRKQNQANKHRDPLSPEDMERLYASDVLNNRNPTALQRKVFFEITLSGVASGKTIHFYHNLTKDSFVFSYSRNQLVASLKINDDTEGMKERGTELHEVQPFLLVSLYMFLSIMCV